MEDSEAEAGREDAEYALRKANRAIKSLTDLRHDIVTGWTDLEIHAGKLDAKNYHGNAIDRGLKYTPHNLRRNCIQIPPATRASSSLLRAS